MSIGVSPTQSDALGALRLFLSGILPSGVEIIQAQDNRVPEPLAQDFVLMTPTRRIRLETNIDLAADVAFTASIAGTVMTVSAVQIGLLSAGATVFGPGVAANTVILSGPSGGPGVYMVSVSQTVSSEKMACGTQKFLQPTEIDVQLDIHGPNSADNAQIISTLFRDDYAVEQFAALNPYVFPLLADDPKQMPFLNGEDQYEWRWIVDARLQLNATVTAPQQYADVLSIETVNVEATYPA